MKRERERECQKMSLSPASSPPTLTSHAERHKNEPLSAELLTPTAHALSPAHTFALALRCSL